MIRQLGSRRRDRRDRGLVGDEAGGEDQRRLLAVQVGELEFQFDQRMVGAGYVARAAGAGAHPAGRLLERSDHVGMLAHAEIVVGAPDGDFLGLAVGPPDRAGKRAGDALEIGEDAVAPFRVDLVDRFLKKPLIVHSWLPGLRRIIVAAFFTSMTRPVKMPRPLTA